MELARFVIPVFAVMGVALAQGKATQDLPNIPGSDQPTPTPTDQPTLTPTDQPTPTGESIVGGGGPPPTTTPGATNSDTGMFSRI
ncbi:hypothetical protein ABW20_dc0105429 [Dactylellina cionopaga]|nr:hypothetical protein ABW20_dc0105429 [Dactylellina cionopaga]